MFFKNIIYFLTDINIHQGRGELGTITSAKMKKYYGNILKDFTAMEFAGLILKKISLASENLDSPEYFEIVDQSLAGLDSGLNKELIESWFWLNLTRISGEEINLYRDINGIKLSPKERYNYDLIEKALVSTYNGELGEEEIKILRLMVTTKLTVTAQIKGIESFLPKILRLARIMSGAV